jgi:phosphatidylserine/phosphatidylglycerophosphate/cardiolipin synthase-like enzyme
MVSYYTFCKLPPLKTPFYVKNYEKLLPAVILLAIPTPAQDKPDAAPDATPSITGEIEVYFSPKGGCTDAVVKAIDAAKTEILAQAYSFTSTPIAKALVDTRKHGINVRVTLEKDQQTAEHSEADFLHNSGEKEKGKNNAVGNLCLSMRFK